MERTVRSELSGMPAMETLWHCFPSLLSGLDEELKVYVVPAMCSGEGSLVSGVESELKVNVALDTSIVGEGE